MTVKIKNAPFALAVIFLVPSIIFRGTNPCLNCIKSLQNCCLYFQAQEEVELGNSKPNYGLVICYGVNFICWLFVMGATSYLIVLFFYTFGLNIIFVLSAFILHIIFMILFITIFTAQVSFSIHHVKMRHWKGYFRRFEKIHVL